MNKEKWFGHYQFTTINDENNRTVDLDIKVGIIPTVIIIAIILAIVL